MRVLFIHQNFPGQYRHLGPALAARGDQVLALGAPHAPGLAGFPLRRYPLPKEVPPCHPWAADFQTKCVRAEAVARLAAQCRDEGFAPDLVIGHPGWGELLAIKDVFPSVPVLHQLEWVYPLTGGDSTFDPEFLAAGEEARSVVRLRRAHQLLAFHDLDHAWAPTHWQAASAPEVFRERISVIHEGIDTRVIGPNPMAEVRLQRAGLTLRAGDEVLTFVARNLEPYRGFHIFMRLLPELLRRRPALRVLIVGADGVSYGKAPAGGGSWRQVLLQELAGQLDLARIHFVGQVPHPVLHQLFQICRVHTYLTYPFVLSWSLLEAMACGAVVVASATPPLQEVIDNGRNGHLVDFFDQQTWLNTLERVLAEPEDQQSIAAAARQTVVERYDLHQQCLPRQLALVDQVASLSC
ncbi:MAG: glycosyltransferase [Cyanobacteriota bacterium]|jgi:glycosyltransferase involved in cell wall biosynthesis